MTTLRLSFDQTLFDDIRQDVADILDDELLELAATLERDSPRGVSSASDSLGGNWDIQPAQIRPSQIQARVFNPLPFALERLAGRGPGEQPPIDPRIRAWALSKGISPYAVAQKIGEFGTDRYIEGESANALRIDPRTKEVPTDKGLQAETTDRIARRIEGIRR
ncbi:MAG: hypothetical protein AAGA46_00295 [Cyanobacteria bacterium P01_F01_bin.13]